MIFLGQVGVGSSPRLRGTRVWDKHSVARPGIIPALAGNTFAAVPQMDEERDHPRACGEHRQRGQVDLLIQGSSPRLRGTHIKRKSR